MSEAIELPFSSKAFIDAWTEFEQHRREIRHKLTPTSTKRLLKKLAAWGEQAAIVALNASVENGWQGVFEPKTYQQARDLADKLITEGDRFLEFMERKGDDPTRV